MYIIAKDCSGKKTAVEMPDDFANNRKLEIYPNKEACELAIKYGLEPTTPKERMKEIATGYMVEFTKDREYRTSFVASIVADNPKEAARFVCENWNVRSRAIIAVNSHSFI